MTASCRITSAASIAIALMVLGAGSAEAVVGVPGYVRGGVCTPSPGEPAISDCLIGLSPGAPAGTFAPFAILTTSEAATETSPEPGMVFSFNVPTMTSTTFSGFQANATWDTSVDDPFASATTRARTQIVIMTDPAVPGATPQMSDLLVRYFRPIQDSSGQTTSFQVLVGMWSDPGPGAAGSTDIFDVIKARYDAGTIWPALGLTVIAENGTLQDVTPYLFPNVTNQLQVLAQSDVEPVPEPQTWAFFAVGIGVVVLRLRRRRVD